MNRQEATGIVGRLVNVMTEVVEQDTHRRDAVDAERRRARLADIQQTRIDMYYALFGTREEDNNG